MTTRNVKNNSGFTLLELLVAVILLGVVLGAIAMAGVTSSDLFKSGITRTGLESQNRRALERVRRTLLDAGQASLDPCPTGSLWTSTLTFDQLAGISSDQGLVEWAPARIELRMEDGETDDGVDENGNGLVDERCLVLIRDFGGADERAIVVSHNVSELLEREAANGVDDNGNGLIDEAGFCANLQGNTVNLWLTLEVLDEDGFLVTRSLHTSVLLRN